ncbi:Protein of unknown function [Gryllus bimaculatus]|nr:Protein of unknown function [Gryllus bimaculatus]
MASGHALNPSLELPEGAPEKLPFFPTVRTQIRVTWLASSVDVCSLSPSVQDVWPFMIGMEKPLVAIKTFFCSRAHSIISEKAKSRQALISKDEVPEFRGLPGSETCISKLVYVFQLAFTPGASRTWSWQDLASEVSNGAKVRATVFEDWWQPCAWVLDPRASPWAKLTAPRTPRGADDSHNGWRGRGGAGLRGGSGNDDGRDGGDDNENKGDANHCSARAQRKLFGEESALLGGHKGQGRKINDFRRGVHQLRCRETEPMFVK